MGKQRERRSWRVGWAQTHEDSECQAEEIGLDSADDGESIKALEE